MPIVNVLDGSAAKAIHVRQILGWLRGVATYTESTKFTGLTSLTEYALEVRNQDTTNQKAAIIYNGAGTIGLFEVSGGKTTLRPATDGSTILSVRNFADSADVFTVSTTGASLGALGDVVTTTATQTLTNKTISAGVLVASRLSDYLDIQRQASAPSNPASGDFRFYALTGSNLLKYRDVSGVERTLVDESTTQTLSAKTLTAPSISAPTISGGVTMVQAAAPTDPGLGLAVLYFLTSYSDLRYKAGNNTERTLVDTESSQTLATKTLTSPTINTGTVGEYLKFNDRVSVAPDPGASAAIIYKNSATNLLQYKSGNTTERTIVDTDSNQTLAAKTLTSPQMTGPSVTSGGLTLAIASAPSAPSSSNAVLYALTSTNDLRYMAGNSTERVLVDTSSIQTIAGKTLTAPTINSGVVGTGGLTVNIGSAPGTPGASAAVLYYLTATNDIRYKAGNNTERTIVDTDSTQTLSGKTFAAGTAFTTPSLTGPVITNYEDYTESSIPSNPASSGIRRLYCKSDGSFYYKDTIGTTATILTDINSTSIVVKSFARQLSLGSM